MATKIVTKNSSTASAVPTASDLVQGELAVNVADKRLFTEDNAGAIVELGTNPSTLTVTGEITANGGIALGDGDELTLGDSDEFKIKHHASGYTHLQNTVGTLYIDSDSVTFRDDDGSPSNMVISQTGIDVTGTATVDGLTSSGIIEASDGTNGEMQFGLGTALTTGAGTYDSSVRWNGSAGNLLFSQGAVEKMRITATGIDVTGTATMDGLVTNTAGTSNFIAGVNAGNSIASGGNYNTVVGDEAGTSITTGDGNVAIGYQAGDALTTGIRNIAIGKTALGASTTSDYNTAIGYEAMGLNTTGTRNTALGVQALYSNVDGDNSVAIGYEALFNQDPVSNVDMYNVAVGYAAGKAVTTGTLNTLIGGLAGDSMTTGAGNTGVGYEALSGTTTASNNTGSGFRALKANTTGADNTAFGSNALDSNTTASNNTAVGKSALGENTTGSENTALGKDAGAGITSGASNVALGFRSLYTSNTASKNVAIGDSALRAFSGSGDGNNTAVGHSAGTAITSGAQNTLIGGLAGDALTTGNRNTALGESALGAVTTGDNNLGVGRSSGLALTTGVNNTFVGAYNGSTGGSGETITTGSKNTILGSYNGNQGGLDIRTSSNNIVLSDGDGNVRAWNDSTGRWQFGFGSGDSVHAYSSNGANTSNSLFVGFHSSSGATTGTLAFNVTTNGNVTNINNSYGAISDVKLKENIIDASSQWDDIKALTVRKYSMKADNLDAPNMLGVVAQEVEAAGMSGLVIESHDKTPDGTLLDTTTKSVNYSILYMKAVKALQEAMERIESLEARITTLEG